MYLYKLRAQYNDFLLKINLLTEFTIAERTNRRQADFQSIKMASFAVFFGHMGCLLYLVCGRTRHSSLPCRILSPPLSIHLMNPGSSSRNTTTNKQNQGPPAEILQQINRTRVLQQNNLLQISRTRVLQQKNYISDKQSQ